MACWGLSVVVLALHAGAMVVATSLLGWQLALTIHDVATNVTTNERLNRARYPYMRCPRPPDVPLLHLPCEFACA